MSGSPTNLSSYFQEVQKSTAKDDYEKALKAIEKILKEDPNNIKALHSKVVCLIRVGDFEEGLKTLDLIPNRDLVAFERAYCLYRLNQVKEALVVLKSVKGKEAESIKIQELMAQCYYRLEEYEEALTQYTSLMKNTDDDDEGADEREANLAAVVASLALSNRLPEGEDSIPELGDQIYELIYNKACIDIGLGSHALDGEERKKKLTEAKKKLEESESICIKDMKEEEATEEEIETELGIIRAQMGFLYQCMGGKEDLALQEYHSVLKGKPDDAALIAVVSNNIVTINKDQSVFDSRKKMKSALNEEAKLSSLQKQSIIMNHALFLMMTGQSDACRKQIKEISDPVDSALIEASLLVKEKNYKDAIDCLKSVKERERTSSLLLTLTQLLLNQGRTKEATDVLTKSLPEEDAMSLGVISTVVSLFLSSKEDSESVIKTLKSAIKWHQSNNTFDEIEKKRILNVLFSEATKHLIKNNRAKEAADLLEQQRKLSPTPDAKVIAQLIAAYGEFDPKKAREMMGLLPSVDSVKDVNVDALESSNWSLGAKYVKKSAKSSNTTDSPIGVEGGKKEGGNVDDSKKKKKKRRRKRIMPKNYDPNVDPDPERWLPKWQRTTFRKKKDRRDKKEGVNLRGTQGSSNVGPEEMTASSIKPSPRPGQTSAQSPSSSSGGPRGAGRNKKKGRK